jgi:hypothetical protein
MTDAALMLPVPACKACSLMEQRVSMDVCGRHVLLDKSDADRYVRCNLHQYTVAIKLYIYIDMYILA